MSIPSIKPYELPPADQTPLNRVNWHLDPKNCALLVHDMQKYFVNFFESTAEPLSSAIRNIQSLLAACRHLGIPVFYTAQPGDQNPKDRALLSDMWGPGLRAEPQLTDIIPELAPDPTDIRLTKWRYSAFKRSDLKTQMQQLGRDQLIITGIYAHIGCLQTAAEAFMEDIKPFFVEDALADFSLADHRMATSYVARCCGQVVRTERLLQHLKPSELNPVQSYLSDIEHMLNLAPATLRLDYPLRDQGMDSIRAMTLVERWQSLGLDLDIADLAPLETPQEWLNLIQEIMELNSFAPVVTA